MGVGALRALRGLLPFVVTLALSQLFALLWVAGVGLQAPPQHADAAVVLGAAVWRGGHPSPAFAMRIRAAATLYQQQRVQWIATTGGRGRHAPSEGEAATTMLHETLQIPERVLITESDSHTTWENLANVAPLLRAHNVRSIVLVSHGYHLARSVRMAQDLGFRAWGYAADGSIWQSVTRHRDHWLRESRLLFGYTLVR